MAPGYVIAMIDVTDAKAYRAYVAAVTPVVERFGGEFLVRGGRSETVEGESPGSRIVVIRFPSYQAARDWYFSEDYVGPKAMRQAASTSVQILAEGL